MLYFCTRFSTLWESAPLSWSELHFVSLLPHGRATCSGWATYTSTTFSSVPKILRLGNEVCSGVDFFSNRLGALRRAVLTPNKGRSMVAASTDCPEMQGDIRPYITLIDTTTGRRHLTYETLRVWARLHEVPVHVQNCTDLGTGTVTAHLCNKAFRY
ncbi:hypothetical protein J6590_019040 [Homalodisca vitripennis]|nr:hypothetical protein J6590_019040 [Homalodisca vitripennis]